MNYNNFNEDINHIDNLDNIIIKKRNRFNIFNLVL